MCKSGKKKKKKEKNCFLFFFFTSHYFASIISRVARAELPVERCKQCEAGKRRRDISLARFCVFALRLSASCAKRCIHAGVNMVRTRAEAASVLDTGGDAFRQQPAISEASAWEGLFLLLERRGKKTKKQSGVVRSPCGSTCGFGTCLTKIVCIVEK